MLNNQQIKITFKISDPKNIRIRQINNQLPIIKDTWYSNKPTLSPEHQTKSVRRKSQYRFYFLQIIYIIIIKFRDPKRKIHQPKRSQIQKRQTSLSLSRADPIKTRHHSQRRIKQLDNKQLIQRCSPDNLPRSFALPQRIMENNSIKSSNQTDRYSNNKFSYP